MQLAKSPICQVCGKVKGQGSPKSHPACSRQLQQRAVEKTGRTRRLDASALRHFSMSWASQ